MTGTPYIFENFGRSDYKRSTIGTLLDKYFVIKTSNLEGLENLVPLDIAGAYVDINDNILLPEFTDYVSVLNVSDCYNCETALKLIRTLAYNGMNEYVGLCKYMVERNSIFYGNRRILIDNDSNVLYISVLNTKTNKLELLVNIKALTDYGNISSAIFKYIIKPIKDISQYIFHTPQICSVTKPEYRYKEIGEIRIVKEELINSFIDTIIPFESSTSDESVTHIAVNLIKSNNFLSTLKNNLFV